MEKQRIQFYNKWNGRPLQDDGSTVSKAYRGFQRAFKNALADMAADLGARLAWFDTIWKSLLNFAT